MEIGNRIKDARESKGLTQEELGLQTGFTQTYISRMERGSVNIPTSTLVEIAGALDISLTDLLTDRDSWMTIGEYQRKAARTINWGLSPAENEMHALFCMASECGEVHGIYQKCYQGHEFDAEHVKKEIGDVMWAVAELCTANGWSLEEICRMNIHKLEERYPNGFDAEHSLHRKKGDI